MHVLRFAFFPKSSITNLRSRRKMLMWMPLPWEFHLSILLSKLPISSARLARIAFVTFNLRVFVLFQFLNLYFTSHSLSKDMDSSRACSYMYSSAGSNRLIKYASSAVVNSPLDDFSINRLYCPGTRVPAPSCLLWGVEGLSAQGLKNNPYGLNHPTSPIRSQQNKHSSER